MLNPQINTWRSALGWINTQQDFQMPLEVFTCGADIQPSRFVALTGNTIISHSGAGDRPYGISVEYPANEILGGAAGVAGNAIKIYGIGYECWLMLAQSCEAGNSLTSNFDGRGIVGQPCGAIALSDGMAGTLVRVRVHSEPGSGPCEFTSEYDPDYTSCH